MWVVLHANVIPPRHHAMDLRSSVHENGFGTKSWRCGPATETRKGYETSLEEMDAGKRDKPQHCQKL